MVDVEIHALRMVTVFSPCRKWRYTLWRRWWKDELFANRDKFRFLQVIGLNPSTADETNDDPTIRRCIGYARDWGFDGLCMTNAFAWRATDPGEMKKQPDPVGEKNDEWLIRIGVEAGLILVAWGKDGAHMDRGSKIVSGLSRFNLTLHCLGRNKDGTPVHPLYQPKNAQPIPFT